MILGLLSLRVLIADEQNRRECQARCRWCRWLDILGLFLIFNFSRMCRKMEGVIEIGAIFCKEGQIKRTVLRGSMWMIPADAENQQNLESR